MAEIKAGLKITANVGGVEEIKSLNATLDGAKSKAEGAASGGKALAGSFDGMPSKLNPVAESLRQAGDGMDSVRRKSSSAGESLVSFGKTALTALGITAALDKVSDSMHKVLDTSKEYAAIRSRMEYAFGGTEAAGRQMEWVKNIANELGLEAKGAAEGYAQLAAATKNINMSTEQTQQVFKGVASAAASMNLSTEETNGVLLALSQIAGKGKVSMEELRGQLGERLSPAMAIAAKSMGVTTAELEKMVEKGIAAEEFLPKFGAAMEEAFKGAESVSAPLNRLKNQLDELMLKLADSGVNDAYNAFLTKIGDSLTWVEEKIATLDGTLIGAAKDVFENTWNTIQTGLSEIGSMLSSVYGYINSLGDALNGITGASGEFDLFKTVLDGLNITLGLLSDGIKGISVAFDVAVGGMQKAAAKMMGFLAEITFGDISENFKKASAEMSAAADESFARAEQKALNFESSAVAAVKASQETEQQRFERLAAEAQSAYEKATSAAIESAQKAKQAQETAAQAVGTSQEEAARKAAEQADKQASAAMRAAKSAETAWEKAFEKTGGSAEALEAVKKPLADLQAQATQSADAVGAVGDAAPQSADKVAAAFAKIGVDVDSATTGISSKAKQAFADFQTASQTAAQQGSNHANLIRASFEQMMGKLESRQEFEAFRTQLNQSGDAAKLTKDQLARLNEAAAKGAGSAKTAYDQLSASLKTIGSSTDLAKIAQQAQAAFESGSISAAQYDQVMAQVNARTQELEQNTAKGGDKAVEAHGKAAEAAKQRETAERGAAQAAKETAKATEESSKAADNASKSFTDYGYRMSQTHGYVKLTTEELEKLKRQFSGVKFGHEAETVTAQVKEWTEQIARANQAMTDLNQATSSGMVNQAVLQRAISATTQAADKLGAAKLAEFRAAIDSAKAKMDSLRQSAQSATAELQAQLDALNGNTEATYAYEHQKKIADLQQKMAEAQKARQTEVAAEYSKQIDLLNQIYAKEKANRAESAKSTAATTATRTVADSGTSTSGNSDLVRQLLSGSSGVNIDTGRLNQILAARDQSVVNAAVESLANELEAAVKRAS